MERFITFCVLIFHSSLVASIPFPEKYNLAYQQPQLQFSAQPQAQVAPARQQYNYGNYENFQPPSPTYGNTASYQNLYYPSHSNFVTREPALQQGQAYNYYLPRQPIVPTQQQTQEEIQQKYQEQAIANQLRTQNAQNVQNYYTLPQSYLNSPPANQQGSQLYVPQEQQLPLVNPPTKQFFSGQIQGNDKIAAALAAAQAAQAQAQVLQSQAAAQAQVAQIEAQRQVQAAQLEAEKLQTQALQNQATQATTSSPQPVNPYQQIYDHIANNLPADQNAQPIQWRNLWKQYAADVAPPKPKKRYLVIHPDGRTEYVDQIETIAKKHPNYVLVNGGSISSGRVIPPSYPNKAVVPPTAAPQANDASSIPVSLDIAPKPQDSSLENPVTNDQITPNTITATENLPVYPDTNVSPLPSDPVPEPTPENLNSDALLPNQLTQAPSPDTQANVAPLPSDPVPEPTPENFNSNDLLPNQLAQAPDSQATQPTNTSSDVKLTPTSPPSDASTLSENSLPGSENPSEPLPSSQNLEKSDSQPAAESSVPEEVAAEPSSLSEGTTTQSEPKTITPSIAPTFVEPTKEDDDLDLSKINALKPPTIFLTSDSDILRELLGDDEISVVYFFQIKPKTAVEKDTKTTEDSNGTDLQERVESV